MPRIQGVDLPPNKPTHISLRYLRGIGPTTALEVCAKTGIDPTRKANSLTDDEVAKIAILIDREYSLVEGALRRFDGGNITRLKEIRAYRGERHRKNLPVRGQRSKTNARTRKGPRKTVAGKKGVKDK
jgi:small subunit ribosomal protein S13